MFRCIDCAYYFVVVVIQITPREQYNNATIQASGPVVETSNVATAAAVACTLSPSQACAYFVAGTLVLRTSGQRDRSAKKEEEKT